MRPEGVTLASLIWRSGFSLCPGGGLGAGGDRAEGGGRVGLNVMQSSLFWLVVCDDEVLFAVCAFVY